MNLTDAQARAVRSWGSKNVCVVAGPGSGKTRVLVERVKWLILDREVPPESVLAVTFTEKAALEMRSRIVAERGIGSNAREKLQEARVSTIDAFCNRLLKENAIRAGIDPGFEILDESEGEELLRETIEQVLDQAYSRGGEPLETFLASFRASPSLPPADAHTLPADLAKLARSIRSFGRKPFLRDPHLPLAELADKLRELAHARDSGRLADVALRLADKTNGEPVALSGLLEEVRQATAGIHKRGKVKDLVVSIKDHLLPECRAAAASMANRPARQWLLKTVRQILDDFQAAKLARDRMDFDDVLARAAELLGAEDPPKLRFQHILIDEFQDTNPLQVRLVEKLLEAHGPNRPARFVVGDINQSIYGFRHADQNVFRKYRESIEAGDGEVVHLLENFRSRREVLGAVHRLLPGGGGSGVEEHRLRGVSSFPGNAFPPFEVQIVSHGGTEAARREAEWLGKRFRELMRTLRVADRSGGGEEARPLQWGDIAVLARTRNRVTQLADHLRSAGVPCEVGSGPRLFETPEALELAAFLRVVRNPRDEISLATVLKSSLCAIDDADLLRLRSRHRMLADALDDPSLASECLSEEAGQRLRKFAGTLSDCRSDSAIVPIRFLLARAIAARSYRTHLGLAGGPHRNANADSLLDWIGHLEQRGTTGLGEVSEALDRARILGTGVKQVSPGVPDGRSVQVMTMHAAKGLEFPVVALASLNAGTSQRQPGLVFSDQHGIGAQWLDPFSGSAVKDSSHVATAADVKAREAAEADRLLYVSMTRAEEHLILSAAFSGGATRRSWCKPVFDRLGIGPRDEPTNGLEVRRAGTLEFLYRKTDKTPGGDAGAGGGIVPDQPQLLVPREQSSPPDYVAAVTSVATFAQCPRRYFLSRYLGLEGRRSTTGRLAQSVPSAVDDPSARDTSDATKLGDEVHRLLADDLEDPSPLVRRLAAKFHKHELGRRAASATRIEKESAFVFTVGDHLLRGTIDLLFEEGGERILLDYKTDKIRRRACRRGALQYAPQLQLYAAGLDKSGRPADRAVIFYLRPAVPVTIDVGESALAGARNLVERFFDAQSRQDFPLRTGSHCRKCPHFWAECPAQLT